MRVLRIYWAGRSVGTFSEEEPGISLQYDAEWISSGGYPISLSLPVQTEPLRSPAVAWFIGNLLPEGPARESLNAQYKLDSTDDFGLLERLGAECAGALSILPLEELLPSDDAPFDQLYEPAMDAYELGQLIQAFATSPTLAFKGHRLRLSLAGVQRKFTVARFEGAIHRSFGGATTHIVKPDIDLVRGERPKYPGMVFNEYFCLRLASACGLDAATVELLPYVLYRDGTPQYAYMTQRCDRRVLHPGRVERLHQEDFCQALGLDRARKYEQDTRGVTLADLFAFLRDARHVSAPAVAQRQLLNGVLFNTLIGNGDAHAKNYALLRNGDELRVAPLYDLLCTQAYPDVNNFFAQRLGHATRFADLEWDDLKRLEQALGIRLRAVLAALRQLAAQLLKQLPLLRDQMAREPYWGEAADIVQRICGIAAARAVELLRLIDAERATQGADGSPFQPGPFHELSVTVWADSPQCKQRQGRLRRLLADNGGLLHVVDRDREFPELTLEQIVQLEAAFESEVRRDAALLKAR